MTIDRQFGRRVSVAFLVALFAAVLGVVEPIAQTVIDTHRGKVRVASTAADAVCIGATTVSPTPADCHGGLYAGAVVATSVSGLVADFAGGRLTLESGVAVSTSDQSAKATLYYTPDQSNAIALYDGSSSWATITFAELSISLAGLTASLPYDVFCYNNSGTATLELLAWTNTTTRATALVKQDGRWVKTGATTRRYLGTVYIDSTGGQSDDTYAQRYVWNANNRVLRPMRVVEATASWTYNSTSFRQANASTANQLDVVVGLPDVEVAATVIHHVGTNAGAANGVSTAIGLDSTTTPATGSLAGWLDLRDALRRSLSASVHAYPGVGRHRIVWLEAGDGSGTTWYGLYQPSGAATGLLESGITGSIEG